MVIAKLYNENCTLFFEYDDPNDSTINNYERRKKICDDINKFNCQNSDKNTLQIDPESFAKWLGWGQSDNREIETAINMDGSETILSETITGKELVLYFPICDTCDCWTSIFKCIFSDCCNNTTMYLEWLDDCDQWMKVEFRHNGMSEITDKDDSGCGYFNFNLREVRDQYIQKSDVYTETTTKIIKLETRTVCEDCINDCYTIDIYNDNVTTRYCINSNKDKIVFRPLENMSEFILIWNNSSYTIPLSLEEGDIIEIEKGQMLLNGNLYMNLSDLGINVSGNTTSNGLDCMAIQTLNTQGVIGVIRWNDVLRCEEELWTI